MIPRPIEHSRRALPELVMRRAKSPNLAGLLVEGIGDRKLFERFVDGTSCSVLSMGGRDEVLSTLQEAARSKLEGLLGVVDQDADLFVGRTLRDDNLFVTDLTDADTLLVCSDAFLGMLTELTLRDGDKRTAETIRSWGVKMRSSILEAGYAIGLCRRLSTVHGWAINFSCINYRAFVDSVTGECSTERLLSHVDSLPRSGSATIEEIVSAVNNELTRTRQVNHVVRGHDLTSILALRSSSLLGREYAKSELEKLLRLAFGLEHLRETTLYKEITQWELRNAPFRVWQYR